MEARTEPIHPVPVRLSLALRAGDAAAEISIDPGHSERLFRMAAYLASRDGLLRPGDTLLARLTPGVVRERHARVYCLESCGVELFRAHGAGATPRVLARVEFPRAVFAAFVAARATHLLAARTDGALDSLAVAYALHATPSADEPLPVEMPALAPLSVARLAAAAQPSGTPDREWVATFVTPEVAAGLEAIARISRASGVEAAARIHTRVGFDAEQRCFVRILNRFVLSRATRATGVSVVSTAASWGEFLSAPASGPQAPASVHTHLHLDEADLSRVRPGGVLSRDGPRGDHLLAGAGTLRASDGAGISINDIVTHYTAFPDTLSAAVIVSLFPDSSVTTVYGYTPQAQLREEPGYWTLSGGGGG